MIRIVMILFLVFLPWTAMSASIYLNGIKIDGIKNQTFENVSVRVDEEGNIHIDAPNYRAKTVRPSPGSTVSDEARVTGRFFLASRQTEIGATEYDIDVFVNSRWIRKFRNDDARDVIDITEHLRKGKNRVLFKATKVISGKRRSFSPEHIFEIMIGEGDAGGDKVVIERPMFRFVRTAAETDDLQREYEFTVR